MNPARGWDVVVVGAGPAGSVAARGLALDGFRVLLLDRARFPRRKVCGACLGPAARVHLRREGLAEVVEGLGPTEVRTLELRAGAHGAHIPLDGHSALTRARLDAALVEAAVAAGATFRDRVAVRYVAPAGGGRVEVRLETSGGALCTRVALDAAGLQGIPQRPGDPGGWPDAAPAFHIATAARIGLGAVFRDDRSLQPGVLRMVAGADGYVGVVRTEDGSVNVAAALAPEAVRRRGADGAVRDVLAGAGLRLPGEAVEAWRGTPALTRHRALLGGAGVLRVGDAAGYVEPFTGEGIGWAVASGVAVRPFAAAAVEGWSDEIAVAWTRQHARAVGRGQMVCRALAGGLRRERLVRAAVAVLARAPALAAPLVRATRRAPR